MSIPKKIHWVKFFARGDHPILLMETVMKAHRNLFHSYFQLPPIRYYLRHGGETYFAEHEYSVLRKIIRKRLFTSWITKMMKKMKKDLEIWLQYTQNLTGKNINQKKLKRFFQLLEKAWLTIYPPFFILWVIEEEIQKLVASFPQGRRENILRFAGQPLYTPEQEKYTEALRAIDKKNFKRDAESIIKRFGYIKSYIMYVRPLTPKDIRHDMQSLAKKSKVAKVETKLLLQGKLQKLVYLARLYNWFRDWRLFMWNKGFFHMKPVFEEYLKDKNLKFNDIIYLFTHEILTKKFHRQDIKKRKRKYGVIMEQGKVRILYGRDLKILEKKTTLVLKKSSLLKGVVACRGKVRGKVCVALPYEFNKIQKGEILVTSETTPESVAYLKHVKAIVTDEGGITSHAAIVSRELGIPCIIGTKIATKVLKDGDMVEVDAEKGIVRKL